MQLLATVFLLVSLVGLGLVSTYCSGQLGAPETAVHSLELCKAARTWTDLAHSHLTHAQELLETHSAPLISKVQPLASEFHSTLLQATHSLQSTLSQWLTLLLSSAEVLTKGASQRSLSPSWHSSLSLSTFQSLQTTGSLEAEDLYSLSAATSLSKRKATTTILTCRHPHECASVAQAISVAVTPATHFLHITGDSLLPSGSDAAGVLQHTLAVQLSKVPTSVILISTPHLLTPGSFAVLNNVLSEGGGLQLQGQTVSPSQALFILLLQDSSTSNPSTAQQGSTVGGRGITAESLEGREFAAREQLQLMVASAAESDMDSVTHALGQALRRRVDFVLHAQELPIPTSTPAADAQSPHVPSAVSGGEGGQEELLRKDE